MSPILAPSAEDLMQPGYVSGAAMARPEILVLTRTSSPNLRGLGAMAANAARRSEESEVSEEPVATIEHSALDYAHIRFAAVIVAATLMPSHNLAFAQDTSFGQRLFQDKADCQFCHGINGDGRGDPRSPGRAANLHETHLSRDQLIEVIGCGRPGTEMPHFDKYAYEDTDCYGLKGKNLGNDAARDPHSTSLTKREIDAVTDYILAKFVGK